MLLDEKKALTAEELEAQEALELPDRELLATVVIGQTGGINVAVGVAIDCVQVQALTVDSTQQC